MSEDKYISWARFLLRLSPVFLGIFATAIVIFLVHWHFDPQFYSNVEARTLGNARFGLAPLTRVGSGEAAVPLSDIPNIMLYWVFIRTAAFVAMVAAIMQQGLCVLSNLATLKTFYEENIKAFETMARYAFFISILSSFNFLLTSDNFSFGLHFPIGPLLFALACVIIARVFDQGRQLSEEQKLIV